MDTYAKSQRVNIKLPEGFTENDIDLLVAIHEKKEHNIAIVLPNVDAGKKWGEYLRKRDVTYYLCDPAHTWDQLRGLTALGVSDVFVSGELGFDLEQVKWYANLNNLQIRCYVNIAQSLWKIGNGFKDFYIRPEDVDFYSNYIDIIEFYDSVENQNLLYEVYFKTKEWNGNLREIIKGLTLDINNYYILGSEFARRRSICGKKCFKGHRCQLCDRLADLAERLENSKDY